MNHQKVADQGCSTQPYMLLFQVAIVGHPRSKAMNPQGQFEGVT
jgi:hypothetical protein